MKRNPKQPPGAKRSADSTLITPIARASRDVFAVDILHEPIARRCDLVPLAEALLLLHSTPDLDRAVTLAHDLHVNYHRQQAVVRALQTTADELRTRLAQIEEQLGWVV